jgi:hypothetical protein
VGRVLDGTSLTILLGTIVDALPPIAAILSIVWVLIRIYETCTVQKLIHGKECKPNE